MILLCWIPTFQYVDNFSKLFDVIHLLLITIVHAYEWNISSSHKCGVYNL